MSKKTTAEKLKKVRSYNRQEQLLLEWKENWYKDQYKTIYSLRQAAMKDDHNMIMYVIDLLQGMTEKRFGTLENMIKIINNRDYELIRISSNDVNDIEQFESANSKVESEFGNDSKSNTKEKCKTMQCKEMREFNIDEMSNFYRGGMSVKDLAEDYGIGEEKIIKLLVTCGVYSSDIYDRIKDMRLSGKSDDEIMSIVGLSKKSFNRYIPYTKGLYGLKEPSDNAKKLREWRKRTGDKNN